MKLNDKQAMIAGRKIQLDTANQANHNNNRHNTNQNNRKGSSNRGSFERRGGPDSHAPIDGSAFRGGRFAQNNNKSRASGAGNVESAPTQRPSLKLAPRTKPLEDKPGSSQNIFGGAKARDEQEWEKKRVSQPKAEDNKDNAAPSKDKDAKDRDQNIQERRRSSQSGRGRGGKGRGGSNNSGGRGKGDNNTQNKKGANAGKRNTQNQQSPEEKAAAPAAAATAAAAKAAPTPAPTPAPAKKEVTNKFALLMDSDSD